MSAESNSNLPRFLALLFTSQQNRSSVDLNTFLLEGLLWNSQMWINCICSEDLDPSKVDYAAKNIQVSVELEYGDILLREFDHKCIQPQPCLYIGLKKPVRINEQGFPIKPRVSTF